MTDKKIYQDDVISFEIPDGYKVTERPLPWMWSIKKNLRNILTIDLIDHFNLESEKEQIVIDNSLNVFGNNMPPKEYCFSIGTAFYDSTNGNMTKYFVGVISLHEEYGIKFTIRDENRDFEISKYKDFFNSIKINEEKYFYHKETFGRDNDSSKKRGKLSTSISHQAQVILDSLDAAAGNPSLLLPDLEHGYFCTAGNRITLFGDASRWAIVFEKTGYHNRSLEVQIEINYFGNCLTNLDNDFNAKYITLFDREMLMEIYSSNEVISPDVGNITIRGESVPVIHDPKVYHKKKIEIPESGEIDIVALTRLLDETHPNLFRASKEEIRACIPSDLPKIMTIEKWNHPAFNGNDMDTKPSDHEVFQFIAEVLATCNPKKWKPKLKPNNDWRNWPDAGTL